MSRLKFATKHIKWTEEQWDCVHFNDERMFNLFGFDGEKFVRHSSKEWYSTQCTKSSFKFKGGRVMVLGMIQAAVTGPLLRLYGKS